MSLRVAQIFVHPIKAARAVSVGEAHASQRGLDGDRVLMVVSPEGDFLTQREHPELARLDARIAGGVVTLCADDGREVAVRLDQAGPALRARVWGDEVDAVDCGAQAAGLLTNLLGVSARLVRMAEGAARPVEARYAESAGDAVSFADGFPLLVTTEASVTAAAAWFGAPIDARRFRPNLVISGAEPFAEDAWHELAIGDTARVLLVKPCSRCSVVDVDPDRGTRRSGSLLGALAPHRTSQKHVMFGQNALIARPGPIRLGDRVELLRRHCA